MVMLRKEVAGERAWCMRTGVWQRRWPTYSISAWSPRYNKDKQLLERIQHRFSRMLPGMKQLSYSQRLRKLGLWSLEARRYRSDLIEVYKMLRGKSGVKFSRFLSWMKVIELVGTHSN